MHLVVPSNVAVVSATHRHTHSHTHTRVAVLTSWGIAACSPSRARVPHLHVAGPQHGYCIKQKF